MGQSKQLLPLEGKPFIRHCLDSIIESAIDDIVVVLARSNAALRDALDGLPVRIAYNEKADSEMADSVRLGISAIDDRSSGVLICLADHPLVTAATFKRLIQIHTEDPDRILIPVYGSKSGHPVLFPKHITGEIFSAGTLKDVVNKNADRVRQVEVNDEGILIDIDTMEDYERAMRLVSANDASAGCKQRK